MLQVHFTPADLGHVMLAPGVSSTWEMMLSAQHLQSDSPPRRYAEWRVRVARSGLAAPVATLLAGCLTPARSTSQLCGTQTLDHYWESALAPYWPALQLRVAADLQERAHRQAVGGLSALLQDICRGAVWAHPVLRVPGLPSGDVRLEGGGLLVQPAYFCPPGRALLVRHRDRHVLVCPVAQAGRLLTGAPDADLARLIGPARVEVLRATQIPGTTSEIAERLGTSVPSVSRHAGALAAAHLIHSRRNGRSVTHSISSLGVELLGTRARQSIAPRSSVA
ncbi:helix-turn-helix domain-containing protein [Allobranchiibius sp. GilTou38]|uniref:helix-turn-helix domain-containing protein n=1 Tax=Allobranchiibius sp. GilTou38 TaxID=2815210 RepID=UPI001AA143F9|nr:helix-turn-helix domain-containing protein [Allobranchiibius sp. GilTou38]MBO1765555.1 helix-turn-helix domain-containing protein [Allobranchiibius sp. GilTou38]